MFISGVANKIEDCGFEFDSYTGADSAPSNVASHAFPIGLEIYGKDASGLGIYTAISINNIIDNCWFESIQESGNGVGLYLDNVDDDGGVPLLRNTIIRNNLFSSDVDREAYIDEAFETLIEFNTYRAGGTVVWLGSNQGKTLIRELGDISVDDSASSNGYYFLEKRTGWEAAIAHENFRKTAPVGKTTDYTITISDLNKPFHNRGASGTVTFTLPPALAGMVVGPISRWTAQTVRIDPHGTEEICWAGAGKYKSLDSNGASITLQCDYAGTWTVIASFGTISDEP